MYTTTTPPQILCRNCGWTGYAVDLDNKAPWGTACPQCVKPLAPPVARPRHLWDAWAETPEEADSVPPLGRHPAAVRPHWRSKRERFSPDGEF